MLHHPALPAILGFLSLIMIAIPIWGLMYSSRERGLPGVATIIEREERPFRGNFHTWVEFGGRRCRVSVPEDTWRGGRPGSNLDIRYNPEQPGEVTHGSSSATRQRTLIYSVLLVFGLLVGIAAWRLWFDSPN